MKKKAAVSILFIILFLMGAVEAKAHQTETHQHITREAFKLLKMSFPGALAEMESYAGTNEKENPLDKSWGSLKIVSGTWIEDAYDVVYHYGIGNEPDFEQFFIPDVFDDRKAFTTITHFWDGDGGPDKRTKLSDWVKVWFKHVYWSFYCENAMQKMRKYVNGDYNYRWMYRNGTQWQGCPEIALAHDFRFIPLVDLYKGKGTIRAVKYLDISDDWNSTSCPVLSASDFDHGYSYEILGRMAHLLQDMSVPAHVHNNSHACKSDQYCDYYERHELSYHLWTAEEIYTRGGKFINPYQKNVNDPIYFLMYFMNQITDHYASGRTGGDDQYDPTFPYLAEIIPPLGPPTGTGEINDANCRAMHDVLIPYAIRATAGLMYWFAVETGQLPRPFMVDNPGFENGFDFWNPYGDGMVEASSQNPFSGNFSGHIQRDASTGNYFGLYQENIAVEPDTEYRLKLRIKVQAIKGYASAAFGIWSSDPLLNHHTDFGQLSLTNGWVEISGVWKSRPDENVIRVMLFGSGDFVGEAYFDGLVLEEIRPQNMGFESGLKYWERYGDGDYRAVAGGVEGAQCAQISRSKGTGYYLGLAQRKIPCEPNTIYRLTLWLKTASDSGHAAAALGNWGSSNTHKEFGLTGGYTDWKEMSGTWTSKWDETSFDIVLYGSTDFSGYAYFDNLVLEKVGVVPLGVSILGPSALGYKKTGTYRAEVVSGSGDYRYQWYKKMDGNDHWASLGTQQTQAVTMINTGFTLKVDVHDNRTGQEGTATKHVEYVED